MAETEVRRPVAPLHKGRISLGDDVLDQRLGYRRGVVARLPGYSETVVELLVAGDPERLQLLDREMLEYVRPADRVGRNGAGAEDCVDEGILVRDEPRCGFRIRENRLEEPSRVQEALAKLVRYPVPLLSYFLGIQIHADVVQVLRPGDIMHLQPGSPALELGREVRHAHQASGPVTGDTLHFLPVRVGEDTLELLVHPPADTPVLGASPFTEHSVHALMLGIEGVHLPFQEFALFSQETRIPGCPHPFHPFGHVPGARVVARTMSPVMAYVKGLETLGGLCAGRL